MADRSPAVPNPMRDPSLGNNSWSSFHGAFDDSDDDSDDGDDDLQLSMRAEMYDFVFSFGSICAHSSARFSDANASSSADGEDEDVHALEDDCEVSVILNSIVLECAKLSAS